jgi:hypothetical protein
MRRSPPSAPTTRLDELKRRADELITAAPLCP